MADSFRVLLCGPEGFFGLFREFLSQMAVDVETAAGVQPMMNQVTRRAPAAVILDGDSAEFRQGGDERAFSFFRELSVPFIWVSSRPDPAEINRVSEGAAAYVLKPFNLREFIERA